MFCYGMKYRTEGARVLSIKIKKNANQVNKGEHNGGYK